MSALLEVKDLHAGYGPVHVVRGFSIEVGSGEVVALLGPNGAGKTTTLLTVAGELPPLSGTVSFDQSTKRRPMHARARNGLAFVTEERSVFMSLTTAENLRVGRGDVDFALNLFPELARRLKITAGLLSGGEQQMLTLARALSRRPRLLFADELSLGLAPLAVDRLLTAVRAAADTGIGVLLVEQHITKVLKIADRALVMRRGVVELEGTAAELRARQSDIEASYLVRRADAGVREQEEAS